jgi:hypothetical protein
MILSCIHSIRFVSSLGLSLVLVLVLLYMLSFLFRIFGLAVSSLFAVFCSILVSPTLVSLLLLRYLVYRICMLSVCILSVHRLLLAAVFCSFLPWSMVRSFCFWIFSFCIFLSSLFFFCSFPRSYFLPKILFIIFFVIY